ncbi:transcription-repair coupling factor, partial [bacterium]|nr:transcription-repair coupling factor [bacterium]
MSVPLAALLTSLRDQASIDIPGRLVVAPGRRAEFLARLGGPVLAVVPGEREAEELADDLALFTDEGMLLPAWETLPFEHVSPAVSTMADRAMARHALAGGAGIVVGSVRAATQRVSPSTFAPIVAKAGDTIGLDQIVDALAAAGYHRTDRVEARGEIAVRGGIVDVFPAQGFNPVRLDFWGDVIDEITVFSVTDQRSIGTGDLVAFPAREFRPDPEIRGKAAAMLRTDPWASSTWDRIADGISFAGIESWLPWLAEPVSVLSEATCTVVLFDPVRSHGRSEELVTEEGELAAALAPTWGPGAPDAGDHPALYLPPDLDDNMLFEAPPLSSGPRDESLPMGTLDAAPGDAEAVAIGITRLIRNGIHVIVAMDGTHAADRVARVLGEAGVDLIRSDEVEPGKATVISMGIHRGFVAPDLGLAVLGEQEIAGRRRAHRRVGPRRAAVSAAYGDLKPSDFVVHHRHGIGRFEGLETRTLVGIERDYLVVAYSGQDRLYVPTDQLSAIRPYTGGESPRLSRMGGADWERTRSRVRQEVAVIAEEVVSLHRKRALVEGIAYAPDTPWQREMEAGFPFEETPDQLTAIADVKADMESGEAMDRLVFGDVGFGKTEIAVRATFKAVQEGKQVA